MDKNPRKIAVEPDKELFHARMKELLNVLKKHGIDLKKLSVVELFARGGEWHTIAYANDVKSLELWEIDERWKSDLQKKFPYAKIKIIDTIKTLQNFLNLI